MNKEEIKDIKEVLEKADSFLKDAECLGFKLTKNEVSIVMDKKEEKLDLNAPARAKFTLSDGTIEIKGKEEFVSRYLNRIGNAAFKELMFPEQ